MRNHSPLNFMAVLLLSGLLITSDTGAASAIDLAIAKSALTQAQQALLNNTCQHQVQVQSFETPWAGGFSGSSGSSSSGS